MCEALSEENKRVKKEMEIILDFIADYKEGNIKTLFELCDAVATHFEIEMAKSISIMIDEEKKIVKTFCLGTVHPDQADIKKFRQWLQDTVIFHLNHLQRKIKVD